MDVKTTSSLTLAAAAAAMFALAPISASAEEVKCVGANACKGQSACKTAESSCKGQNTCKGHGFIMSKSAAECTEAGGTVEEG